MLKKKSKSLSAIILIVAIGMTTLMTACKNNTEDAKTITYNLGNEVKTIDPALNQTVDGSNVIFNTFEGLYRIDKNNQAIPGIAKNCDISKDGKTYTFKLRSAKWSDGKPVTTEDFKYAWLRVLNRNTAAAYASELFYIKGSEDYFNGKGKAEDVGIQTVDDNTLKVTLNSNTPYFLNLLTTPCYMPLRKDIVEKNKENWTLKPETYISDGPFKLQNFKMKDSYTLVKNDNYWDKTNVKPKKLIMKMISDETSAYAAVKNGEIDISDIMPSVEIQNAVKNKNAEIDKVLSNIYIEFNLNNNVNSLDPQVKKAMNNKYFRQALAYSVDTKKLTKDVMRDGSLPATSYVPTGMNIGKDPKKDFENKKYIDPNNYTENLQKAKDLLAKAGYKDGKGLPTFTLLYNALELNKSMCEAIQQMWAKIGVKVQLQNQEWTAYENTRKTGNFQIALLGWSADYPDPMTFLDIWNTNNDLNDGRYSSSKFDVAIDASKNEMDKDKRSDDLTKAEDILMDDMPMVPLSFKTRVRPVNPKLKGYIATNLDSVLFANAYKTK